MVHSQDEMLHHRARVGRRTECAEFGEKQRDLKGTTDEIPIFADKKKRSSNRDASVIVKLQESRLGFVLRNVDSDSA